MKGDNIVIMSIHQPRYSIFKLFDSLTLLSLGNVVYHGQASNALEYFHNAGIEIEDSYKLSQYTVPLLNLRYRKPEFFFFANFATCSR